MSAAPTAIWQVVVNRRHDIPQIFTTFTVIVHQLPVMHSYVGTACWGLSQSSHDEYQAKNIWVTHQHMLNRMTEQIHPLGTETFDLVPPMLKISVLRSSKWPRNAKQPFGRQMFKLGWYWKVSWSAEPDRVLARYWQFVLSRSDQVLCTSTAGDWHRWNVVTYCRRL